jgi:hypothetical protein
MQTPYKNRSMLILLAGLLFTVCSKTPGNDENEELSAPELKELFEDAFVIGAALDRWQVAGDDVIGVELLTELFIIKIKPLKA